MVWLSAGGGRGCGRPGQEAERSRGGKKGHEGAPCRGEPSLCGFVPRALGSTKPLSLGDGADFARVARIKRGNSN